MLIDGIAISGYRSFGPNVQKVAPLGQVNVFAGQNNSGKSNVLRLIHEHYNWICRACGERQPTSTFQKVDKHIGPRSGPVVFGYAWKADSPEFRQFMLSMRPDNVGESAFTRTFRAVLETSGIIDPTCGLAWLFYRASNLTDVYEPELTDILANARQHAVQWRSLWQWLTHGGGGILENDWVPGVIKRLQPGRRPLPDVHMIPAVRRIGDKGTNPDDFSGMGIIDRLAKLQNPSHDQQAAKHQFAAINDFLRSVTENASATIEIPYERDMILVHMDDRTLPLASLGTGIHEVIILAAAATILSGAVLCI